MSVVTKIKAATAQAINTLYNVAILPTEVLVNDTKPEFEGDYTVVLFSFIKQLKQSPEKLGNDIGYYLVEHHPTLISGFNIIKGFLNLSITDIFWKDFLHTQYNKPSFFQPLPDSSKVMIEYASPNTNKPLHLGHLRNIFLGWSMSEIYKATGNQVVKTCIANDRGIHICKSMVCWQLFGNGATPESTGLKGDHFVGDYYVMFGIELKKQVAELTENGMSKDLAEKEAPIMKSAQKMLQDWEAGVPEVMELWRMMNSWVYSGFDVTYKRIGCDFDKVYYESETYILGKQLVEIGLQKSVFYKKDDGSVWIDLTNDGLDEKIVQRNDGTAVYITQDIGLAVNKYDEFKCDNSIYVVGDEQNYHFKVLKLICQKLELPSAEGIYHLSYGMVELPTGRMKTREGTVVDADDIVDEMVNVARKKTEELGKVQDFEPGELLELYDTIGIGALKFFLLRVDPKRRMIFNPEDSIDFHGFTAPFIQFTHARIKSILRRQQPQNLPLVTDLLPLEKALIKLIEQYPNLLQEAAVDHDPSKVAIYCYNLAKTFSSFYTEHSITNAESEEKMELRLQLGMFTASVIKNGMNLLGINVPERM